MRQILQSYLRRLTNLSSNNRSLLLLRLASDQFIDIHDFDHILGKPSFSIIEGLISRKNKIPLCDILDCRDGDSNSLSVRLKKLQRIEKFIFEERGGKDLYVGWPLVRGQFTDGSPVRCPLLFFPVEICTSHGQWILELRKNVNVTLNKSFLLAYAYFNNVKVNEELLERVFDDFDEDSRIFRTSLYELFKESEIELNFNQENFIDKLIRFEKFKRLDIENLYKPGELKLYPEAILGIFPQAGSYLVPDYIKLIEDNPIDSFEDFFVNKTIDSDKEEIDFSRHSDTFRFLSRIKEEQTFTPFEMDAYQENAIKAVKSGNSVVVQGPPGTGKSQMICNLICDYIARGKNVLLVCQKRAALDVVYKRLHEKDIVDFVGLVHDFKNDRKEIYEQITSQIDRLNEYKQKNNSLDTIQLERQFLQESRKIDQLNEQLEEYKSALFDSTESGKSAKELYLNSELGVASINIKQEYKFLTYGEAVDQFEQKLQLIEKYAEKFESEEHPWKSRRSFSNYGVLELNEMKSFLEEIPALQTKIASETRSVIQSEFDLEDAATLIANCEVIDDMLNFLKEPGVFNYFCHMTGFSDKRTDSLWLANTERVLMDCYKGVGPEISQDSKELGRLQEALQRSIDAGKNVFKWFKWKLFSKDKILISRVLIANDLKNVRKSYKLLVEKVDNRLNLEHNITKVKKSGWLKNLPESFLKIDLQQWFHLQKKALNAKLIFNSLRSFNQYFNLADSSFEDFEARVNQLMEISRIIPERRMYWLRYFTGSQIQHFASDTENTSLATRSLSSDFDSMVDYDQIRETLLPNEQIIHQKLMEAFSDHSVDSIMDLFRNSLALTWLDHIETKYPILRSVSSLKFDQMEIELQEAVRSKLEISNDILLLKAREKTFTDLEFNRLNNVVTYRDLYHQVTKKRRIWPVRRLISNFQNEIFDLIPCWMVSPEAASAIFPMAPVFDLVVFDEASQCFAERGLPAMYRGKQVVVTGDDKQLKPNDLYRVRWEDENDDDLPELDVDSLLNLAKQHLMQVQLRGHYRSKSLSLINFSNKHFYNNKLRLLPDFEDINSEDSAIEYLKVDGTWENNSNYLEADEVSSLVLSILKNDPFKEIGVVTFNAPQQSLILDLLEEKAIAVNLTLPTGIFVKNIENVQGDEKDIIIFSIGYAPDKRGRIHMQFGSLNLEGGENRLNVAVTRAREKIYLVCSIHPTQLKVDDVKNPGPKLLKKYLEYALSVSEGNIQVSGDRETTFSHNWYLKSKLTNWDIPELSAFSLTDDMPFTDLTIKRISEYKGLVLTDDDIYYDSISAKQAHAYWPFIMSKKGWIFTKFHSREYWLDKEATRDKLVKFLNRGAGVEAVEK
ncbi:MAG: AAA domain-containing protein [Bacteroidetes bacterium]|nr:AAA domain-containing protein [Bacteroidota bacterium]